MDTQNTVTEPDNIEDFDTAWQQVDEKLRTLVRVVYGLIGLSRLGEHPVEVARFAAYLDRTADQAITLLNDSAGALFTPRLSDRLITLDLARPEVLRRRHLRIGPRRIAMSGCAPDLFLIAAVLDTPFQVEDTCPTTGTPIQVDFVPPHHRADLVEALTPAETVVALDPRLLSQTTTMTPEQIDTNLCAQMPFFANPDAAVNWLAGHPTRRVRPVRQMHQLDVVAYARDVLRPLITAHLP